MLRKLADYPAMLAAAAASLAPHEVTFYLRELAATFHSYYAAERFLVDDPKLARARLALLAATRKILKNGLAVLPTRRLPGRLRRRHPDRARGGARRRALRHQGAGPVRQQGADAIAGTG